MKICTIPYDIVYASPEDNFSGVAHALSQVETDTDVVVLPELFTTAFIADEKTVATLAETNDGRTIETLKRWAQFFGFAIAGSFLATDGSGKYFNRAFLSSLSVMSHSMTSDIFSLSQQRIRFTPEVKKKLRL